MAYKGEPLRSISRNAISKNIDISSVQRSILKMLGNKEGRDAFLNLIDDDARGKFLNKYPELGD